MFKTRILSTAFTSDAADVCFKNITGQSFSEDVSFLSTLRALLAPRMQADDVVSLRFGHSSYNASSIGSVTKERAVNAICNGSNITSDRG